MVFIDPPHFGQLQKTSLEVDHTTTELIAQRFRRQYLPLGKSALISTKLRFGDCLAARGYRMVHRVAKIIPHLIAEYEVVPGHPAIPTGTAPSVGHRTSFTPLCQITLCFS